ncbi:MAG: Fic family protein [Bacteroidaceae bacterium]|nr:Fic family protein [Bacteroidaceae bacterium]
MHPFDYIHTPANLLVPEIVALIARIREGKGRQEVLAATDPERLERLVEVAKVQSTKASNLIEGIYTTDERLKALMDETTEPRNRSEEEIVGYRAVLATIHEHYEYIPLRTSHLLQLHRDLYSYTGSEWGGRWKNTDNVIAETDADGNQRVRFAPLPAYQTAEAMELLCEAFGQALQSSSHDPLLLIGMWLVDFLCIHPFADGNGRMSRLVTLLLLYRSNLMVGRYVSIEHLIEQSKDQYYEALRASSQGWHEGTNDYAPFVRYLLGILARACRDFDERAQSLQPLGQSAVDRVRAVFDHRLGAITAADLGQLCPELTDDDREKALAQLQTEGYIRAVDHRGQPAFARN